MLQLGIHPSRLVALVDDLERTGIIERRRNPQDRRHHALHLTEQGWTLLTSLAAASAEHEAEFCATLTDDERTQLALLPRRITDQQGLTPGVASRLPPPRRPTVALSRRLTGTRGSPDTPAPELPGSPAKVLTYTYMGIW